MTNDAIASLGEDKFLEIAFTYIYDESDKRSIEDFLSDLKTSVAY